MRVYDLRRTLVSLTVEDNVHWKPRTTLKYIEAEKKQRDSQCDRFYRTRPYVRRWRYVGEPCDIYPLFMGHIRCSLPGIHKQTGSVSCTCEHDDSAANYFGLDTSFVVCRGSLFHYRCKS